VRSYNCGGTEELPKVPRLHDVPTMPPGSTKRMWTPSDPTAPPPKRQKTAKLPKPETQRRRWGWLRVLKWLVMLGFLGLCLGVATVAIIFWMYGRDPSLPDYAKLSDYHPKQVTTILDANDKRIGELFSERRTFVPFEKIPAIVVDSFIAAEDNKFYSHAGVDYWGMFRAAIANVRAGHTTQGASTITQQVVKTLLLTPERSFKRKIEEIILARRLEKVLTKQEILTLYLNQIYFGQGRYGIQEAALFYFGKDVSQLTVGDAAILAALPNSPEPLSHELILARHGTLSKTDRTKLRQIYVLNKLAEMGKITQAEALKWIEAPIQIIKDPFPELGTAPEWIDLVHKELVEREKEKLALDNDVSAKDAREKAEAAIERLGGTVRTTLDPSLQLIAQHALQAGLRAVDKRHGIGRAAHTVKAVDAEIARLAKKLSGGVPNTHEIYDAVVTEVRDNDSEVEVDLGKWQAAIALGDAGDARFNAPDDTGATKKPSERFKPGDVLQVVVVVVPDDKDDKAKKHHVTFAPGPEGAVVILDLKTRKVRALVGGYTSRIAGFDRATQAKRQAGSSFKPFVYAAAFDAAAKEKCHSNDPGRAKICGTPGSVVNDAPDPFYDTHKKWLPKNFEGTFEGPIRLRVALAKSVNTVSIRVTDEITPAAVVQMAHQLGITSELPTELSIALGAGEVTPLELTNALATLAVGGKTAKPQFIDAIDGKTVPGSTETQVLDPAVAYVVTNMMQSVVTEGTGAQVGATLKIPIAGKTGTSNDARDTWFVGLTPDYAIGVWVGYDDNRPMPGEQGARVAAPIYIDVAKAMKLPGKAFAQPKGVVERVIDRETGLLAPDGAPKGTTMTEVYVEGTQPTETATKAGDVTEGNSVTGAYND
jgi:penicillin-binding protein 1A